MGFLDFLKKKSEPEELNFTDIDRWLEEQVESKKLGQRLKKTRQSISAHIKNAYDALQELEAAGLKNENIPEKAKQVMQGHKKAYVMRIKRFLKELELPEHFSHAGQYAASFSESLDELTRETQKNYMVLKEFVEDELSKLARDIKNIELELAGLQKDIEKAGIQAVQDARSKLDLYYKEIKKKSALEEQKAEQEQELERLRQKHAKHESRISELKQSQDFNTHKQFMEKKKSYEEQLENIEKELKALFAELNRPLKKYKRQSLNERLIDKYMLDPAGALQEDDSLMIREVLNKMKNELESLELKEKQLEKTEELIQKLNKDFLTRHKLEIGRLKGLNKDAATRINQSVVMLNISEQESFIQAVKEKIEMAEQALESTARELEQLNPDYIKQKVKEKVRQIKDVVVRD